MFVPENELERSLVAAVRDPAARPDFYRQLVASNIFVADGAMFSSLTRLNTATYREMNALEFLKSARGTKVLLNPGSTGKEFLPEEIESILDGSIWQFHRRETIAAGTEVLIAQPARYPTELVETLQRLFGTDKGVKRAYLAHFSTGDTPHTLVAIDTSDDFDRIAGEAVALAQGVAIPDPPVDFVRLRGSGLESYFAKVKPFYRRKVLGIF